MSWVFFPPLSLVLAHYGRHRQPGGSASRVVIEQRQPESSDEPTRLDSGVLQHRRSIMRVGVLLASELLLEEFFFFFLHHEVFLLRPSYRFLFFFKCEIGVPYALKVLEWNE